MGLYLGIIDENFNHYEDVDDGDGCNDVDDCERDHA